jgi:membrane protease YdiL (CAAX protease family)
LRNFFGIAGGYGFCVTLLIAARIRGRVVGRGIVREGLGNDPMRRLPAVVATALAVAAYAIWLSEAFSDARADSIAKFVSLSPGATIFAVLLVMLLFGVLAPLSEELFLRGWLWTGLRKHWSVLPVALFTSALWLGLHLGEGILKPVIYYRSWSCWPQGDI